MFYIIAILILIHVYLYLKDSWYFVHKDDVYDSELDHYEQLDPHNE